MQHHLTKRGCFLGTAIISVLLVVLTVQWLLIPSAGLAQGDFDCPMTLMEEDCAFLESSQRAMNEAESVHVDAYDLAVNVDLDGDRFAFSSSGSGDVLLQDGDIVGADIGLDDAVYSSADMQFAGDGILRLVDGVVYLGIVGDDEAMSWVGSELSAILPEVSFLGEFAELWNELNDLPTVVSWGRDEDFELDGTSVAVFYMDFSARGLLQSSVFVEWLAESLTDTFAETIEGDLISPVLVTAVVSELANQVSQDIGDEYIFRITQLISLDDYLVQRIRVELDFMMELEILGGFTGSLDSEIPELLAIDIDFDATLGAHNDDVSIEAPESYEDISAEIVGAYDSLLTDLINGLGAGDDNGDVSGNSGDSTELVVGEAVSGALGADGNPTRYRFEASIGDIVQIGVRADEGSNLDTYLELFARDGERLADNDDAFSPPSALNLGPLDSYIEYEIEEDGIYVVEVSSVFAGDAGSYTLTLAVE